MFEVTETKENMEARQIQEYESMECENEEVLEKMNQVFNNELIINKIFADLPLTDRKNAKLVCSTFREELRRQQFIKDEYITFRQNFGQDEIQKLDVVSYRNSINIKFADIESFENQPTKFWTEYGNKIQKITFNQCKINLNLLLLIMKHCKNVRDISHTTTCNFDDKSGWVKLEVDEFEDDHPVSSLMRSPSPSVKREQGKLYFNRNVKPYLQRLINICANMHVYADTGKAKTFVFEWKSEKKVIALNGWDDDKEVTFYTASQLDASPEILTGWSTFHSYFNSERTDEKSNPRWITVELEQIKHLIMQPGDPSFIVYKKNCW